MEEYKQVLGLQGANEFVQSLKQLEDYYEDYIGKLTTLRELVDNRLRLIQKLQQLPTLADFNNVDQILGVLSEVPATPSLLPSTTEGIPLLEGSKSADRKTKTPRKSKKKEEPTPEMGESDRSEAKETNLIQLRLQAFREMSLLDAIATILDRQPGQPMQTQDLIDQVYGKRLSKENFTRVKLLMNSTLSRGKKANRWQSVEGRSGYYVSAIPT